MGRSGGFREPHDSQYSQEDNLTHRDSPHSDGLLGAVSRLCGRLKRTLEIGRPEHARAIKALRSPGEVSERPGLGHEISGEPKVSRPRPVNFWSALDRTERDAVLSVACERTFAVGDTLVHEGDPADHVIVILDGWTEICVHDHGRERTLAERGPGQLVGERGAMEVNMRSASVVALERVRALIVPTEKFAALISTHSRVLSIVEDLVYDRLTEQPTGRDDRFDTLPITAANLHATAGPSPNRSTRHSGQRMRLLKGENCTIIFTDVVAFGSRSRNDEDRRIIREAILNMTQAALQGFGDAWSWEDRGDGLLTVVSPSIPTGDVIGDLLTGLPGALRRHNIAHHESARIQLRVSVNVGPIVSDRMGLSSEAVIVAARMLDAPEFKKAMAKSGASLGIIASTFVYENVIRHSRDRGTYAEIQVVVKEYDTSAWIRLVDKIVPPDATYPVTRERHRSLLVASG